jgi:peptidylprolyl isomerase
MTSHKDYYQILGVAPNADSGTIEAAYERLAEQLQPDLSQPPADPERMAELDEAFDVLDDPQARAAYDRARGIKPADEAVYTRRSPAARPPARPKLIADRKLLAAAALMAGGAAALAAAAVALAVALTGESQAEGPLVTTESGLQYQDLKVGSGQTPREGNQVSVHYIGALEDGTVFDRSRDRGFPFTFLLGSAAVIEGWHEGVATMRVGGKRRLIVPPHLAYGPDGFRDIVPPNATLIFEVELLDVKPGIIGPETPPELDGEEIVTDSGLRYIKIAEGTGIRPRRGQKATVHYTGWLQSNNYKFDSSHDRQQAFTFTIGVGEVIAGWDEGILGMKVGERRRLIIPPELAYGAEGSGAVPPNETLIFDVHLIDVQ